MNLIPGGLVGLEVEGLEQFDNGDLDLHHCKSLPNTGPANRENNTALVD
jgi:hypothetical protein